MQGSAWARVVGWQGDPFLTVRCGVCHSRDWGSCTLGRDRVMCVGALRMPLLHVPTTPTAPDPSPLGIHSTQHTVCTTHAACLRAACTHCFRIPTALLARVCSMPPPHVCCCTRTGGCLLMCDSFCGCVVRLETAFEHATFRRTTTRSGNGVAHCPHAQHSTAHRNKGVPPRCKPSQDHARCCECQDSIQKHLKLVEEPRVRARLTLLEAPTADFAGRTPRAS
jgi:hypothetical protein